MDFAANSTVHNSSSRLTFSASSVINRPSFIFSIYCVPCRLHSVVKQKHREGARAKRSLASRKRALEHERRKMRPSKTASSAWPQSLRLGQFLCRSSVRRSSSKEIMWHNWSTSLWR